MYSIYYICSIYIYIIVWAATRTYLSQTRAVTRTLFRVWAATHQHRVNHAFLLDSRIIHTQPIGRVQNDWT
jgi:uncharacterized membrane protein